jgi:tetratricopeptide (TPR) repeat protein
LLFFLPGYARKGEKKELTTEQEQQFTYYWYAARQALEENDYPKALVLFEFCDAIKPNDGKTLEFLGILYHAMRQEDRAMDAFKRAFEADPRDCWYRYSSALLEEKTEEATIEAMHVRERALKENPKDDELMVRLQRVYISLGEWKKALKMQDQIDGVKGFDASGAVTRYRLLLTMKQPKKALATIDKYLELDPTDLQFLVFRVEVLEQMKTKPAELYAAYDKILAIYPGHIGILNNYAYHLATHKGDLQRAERMSEQTIREEPNNAIYLDTYGWILHLKGQDELAKFYLNRALINAQNEETTKEVQKHLNAIK